MGSRISEHEKHPIYQADIERCRKNIRTGQKIRMRIQGMDAEGCKRTVHKMCTVAEKHKWIFVAGDSRGRLYSASYIDMIMQCGA